MTFSQLAFLQYTEILNNRVSGQKKIHACNVLCDIVWYTNTFSLIGFCSSVAILFNKEVFAESSAGNITSQTHYQAVKMFPFIETILIKRHNKTVIS